MESSHGLVLCCADEEKAGAAGGCCRGGRKPIQAAGAGGSPASACSRASLDAEEQEGRERRSAAESPDRGGAGGAGAGAAALNGFSELVNGNGNGLLPSGAGGGGAVGRHEAGALADGRAGGKHRGKSSPEHGAHSLFFFRAACLCAARWHLGGAGRLAGGMVESAWNGSHHSCSPAMAVGAALEGCF